MTKFELHKKYPTRNGGEALILDIAPHTDFGITAAFYTKTGDFGGIGTTLPNGRRLHVREFAEDILPPPPETQTHWVNVYRHGDKGFDARGRFSSRAEADKYATDSRIGCHRITLRAEFEDELPELKRDASEAPECRQRCMHCGDYADECMCDGGRS